MVTVGDVVTDASPHHNRPGSALSIVHVYPTLLGLYGDRGNALVLADRARARGMAVDLIAIDPGQAVPRLADIYLVGGGEDGAQTTASHVPSASCSPSPSTWPSRR